MSTQQDIYVAGSENHPPMLNKDNYVPWSSRLLCYAKSKANGKLLMNSIIHGPYVRRMIYKPGDPNGEPPIAESTHKQTNDELTKNEEKQMKKMIKLFRLYSWMKHEAVNEVRAEQLAKTHDHLALMANAYNPYNYPLLYPDQPSQITYMQHPSPNNNYVLQPSFNTNYMQNPDEIINPTTAMNMTLVLMAKAFKLNYSTLTKNNQRILSNPCNRKIVQPGMNMGQERQMQMVRGKGRNQFRQYAGQNSGNQIGYNVWLIVGNPNRYNAMQNAGNQQHGLRVMVMGTMTIRYGVTTAEDWVIMLETAQSDQGEGMLLIFRLSDIEEIKEVNANCILMANLQQALTLGTQTDKALVYDSDESAEAKMDPSGGTVGQHPNTVAKTHS
ncbi:hypothetical protein Tco_0902252, partial [Tanacetum coccineum]